MGTNAFTPMGNTVTFTANTSAPIPVQAVSSTLGGNQYRIVNQSANVSVFLGFASTSANATNAAAVVTTTGPSLILLPGTDEILSFVPNAWFTGITASGNAAIYITPGDGA